MLSGKRKSTQAVKPTPTLSEGEEPLRYRVPYDPATAVGFVCASKGVAPHALGFAHVDCTCWLQRLHLFATATVLVGYMTVLVGYSDCTCCLQRLHLLATATALVGYSDCTCWIQRLHLLGTATALVGYSDCTCWVQ